MKVAQIYTNCLAEASYYIESDGEVAIIDPLRESEPYISKAAEDNAKIKYVLETHFHADFVSGHIDLAKATDAQIIYGPTAQPQFNAYVAKDEEELTLGKVTIKVLHTPGHTMESSCYLLKDESGKNYALFTGDTLFIGDVGRPDLAVKTDLTQEDLAGYLYDSIRNKIMPLADEVIIYPGHGAGSACGKNMSKETSDTLGNQKLYNYALKESMSKEDFIKEVTNGLVAPPQYFPKNAQMNKKGYESIDDILKHGTIGWNALEFMDIKNKKGALVIDTRNASDFLKEHIPGAWWFGIDDNFAPWVGALVKDIEQPILIIAALGREKEVVTRLARVGYDHSMGYLEGGLEEWKFNGFETDEISSIGANDFVGLYDTDQLDVLDVRKKSEYDSQHIVGVKNFPLDTLQDSLEKLDKNKRYYIHCQGGYRSVIAAAILKANGFHDIINIEGGINEIKKSCVKVTKFKEPTTML